MAKFYNNQKKSGRVAGSVFAIRFGETIERAYNPVVSNPSTPSQVASRAKLKLLSQLGAVMASVIAIRREGAVSTRNLFTKINYPAATYSENQADITLTSIKLTRSVVGLPAIVSGRSEQNQLQLAITASDTTELNRVVYAIFEKQTDKTLRLFASRVVTAPGENNQFATQVEANANAFVVYAYGVRDNTEAASAAFGELTIETAETVAKILVTRNLTDSDVTLTETRSVELPARS